MSDQLEVEYRGYESYPAPPWGFVTRHYADQAQQYGIEMPEGLIVVDSFNDITSELIEQRDAMHSQPPGFLRRAGNRVLEFIGQNIR